MSKMTKELRKLDAAKLQQRVAELREQLVEQTRAKKAGESTNPMAARKARREIAAALTLMAEAQQPAAEPKEVK